MPYPDDLLVSGERVIVHEHPHWKTLVVPSGIALVTATLGLCLAWWSAWVTAAALVGALWLAGLSLLRWRTTYFTLTTKRLLVRKGVLATSSAEIPIHRIVSMQVQRSPLDRALGCGTLVVESASDEPLEFGDIPDVERVRSLLYDASCPSASRQYSVRLYRGQSGAGAS